MSKVLLTNGDHNVINDFNSKFEAGLEALDRAKQLKEGDYLVLYLNNTYSSKMELQVNSYGAPVKYMVVFTTKHSIPFVKKVNKKGTPVGKLYSCVGHLESDDYKLPGQKFQFELDPDFADSLLLQDNYDPSTLHKSKRDIWKTITDHNKGSKIKNDLSSIANFFSTLNIGDTIWSSNVSYYLIQDKKTMSRTDFNAYRKGDGTRVKGPFVIVLTVRDKKGNTMTITADFFYCKALYKSRPRSYKELNT